MRTPLGVDEEIWRKRNEIQLKTYGKHKSYRQGLKAGKKGLSKGDNPYTLTEEMWKLLRRRAYWLIGYDDGFFRPAKKKHKHRDRDKELKKIKHEFSDRHKHKKKSHHRKSRRK